MTVQVADVRMRAASAAWAEAARDISVVVATYQRNEFLAELLERLEDQTASIEVVIADDGSGDDTWSTLQRLVATTSLPLLALRLDHSGGPSIPRNTAAINARGSVIAFTDDDCLPDAGWAAAITAGLGDGTTVVQGATRPTNERHGRWDRTVSIAAPTGLFETCNLGVTREAFLEAGGFPVVEIVAGLPRGFGEDVLLGSRASGLGAFAWVPDAVVEHRWITATFADHLDGRRRLVGFPWLAREVPEVAGRLRFGMFLSTRTMQYDTAVASVLLSAITRRPLLLAGMLPWLRSRLSAVRAQPGRGVVAQFAQEAVADTVGFGALVRGSIRHRRAVL
jgi:glycosyltransferase involved in cell wall biosynthesis